MWCVDVPMRHMCGLRRGGGRMCVPRTRALRPLWPGRPWQFHLAVPSCCLVRCPAMCLVAWCLTRGSHTMCNACTGAKHRLAVLLPHEVATVPHSGGSRFQKKLQIGAHYCSRMVLCLLAMSTVKALQHVGQLACMHLPSLPFKTTNQALLHYSALPV